MRTRFFYAEECFNTWPKLFVLTEDGKFYCEYLDYMVPTRIVKQFDFDSFKESDYQFEGYQTIREISREDALNVNLTRQMNWIWSYLNRL